MTVAHRHLIVLGLVATTACGGRGSSSAVAPAPATPEATLQQFLAAANANDQDAMAMLWGSARGPEAVTHTMSLEQRSQRLTIMQRMLRSDSHQITGTNATDPERPVLTVAMTQGTRRFAVPFTFVRWREGGWLVNNIALDAAMPQAAPPASQRRPGN